MTEKQKMLRGDLYNSRDPELLSMYFEASKLVKKYNSLEPEALTAREGILTELLEFKGDGIWIEPPFYCNYGSHISLGKNTFINSNCTFLDSNSIVIGSNSLIGPNVHIYTVSHPLNALERVKREHKITEAPYRTYAKPVRIGNNVWIGGNTLIMPGIKIGDNTTIGAGSVITNEIPANVLAFGNPCKVIKTIK